MPDPKSKDIPICYYCGSEWPGTIDHIPPKAIRYLYRRNWATDVPFLTVPSCFECNVLLGAKDLPTYRSRLEYLLHKYPKRYRKDKSITERLTHIAYMLIETQT